MLDGHGHKATSVDGVRFDFDYSIDELDLRPGGYVSIGGNLGQVHTLETDFRMGESLVAGKFASHPAFVRFGPRIAEEGGADVPATWAAGAE